MKDAYNIDSITITELVYNGLSTKWYFPIVTFTNKEHIINKCNHISSYKFLFFVLFTNS